MEDTTRGPGSAQQTSENKTGSELASAANTPDYEERFQKLESALNKAHATIRKLQETKKTPDPLESDSAQTQTQAEPKKSASEKALEARLKAMEEKDAARQAEVRQEKVNAALETAANKLKIDPDRMDDFFAYVDRKYGKKVVIDPDTKAIVFRDSEEDDAVGLMEWLAAKNTAKEFDRYKPAPAAPTKGAKNNAGPGSGGAEFELTLSEFVAKQTAGQIPLAEMSKYKIVG